MKAGVDERGYEAGQVTGPGESGVQTGGEVDTSQYQSGQQPSQQQPQQQEQSQQYSTSDYWNGDTYDAAAAAEAARRAAAEAERRRIEALNERQHRQNDQNIREEAFADQIERRSSDGLSAMMDRMRQQDQRFVDAVNSGDTKTAAEITNSFNDDIADTEAVPVDYFNELSRNTEVADVSDNQLAEEAQYTETRGKTERSKKKRKRKDIPNQREYDSFRQDNGPVGPSGYQAATSANPAVNPQVSPATQYVNRDQQVAAPTPQREETDYEQVTRYINDYNEFRNREANATIAANYNAWREAGNEGSMNDYIDSAEFEDDPEAFKFTLKSMMNQHYASLDDHVNPVTGEVTQSEDTGVGVKFKDTLKQDRLIDSVVRAFKIGFFHITTEHVETDAQGNRSLRWSKPVETRIIRLCDYLGMDRNSVDSHRTVFRLVTLYGSIGFDRQGKMFNEDKDEWSLTEQEFCDICDMIYQSCVEHGHPLAAPFHTSVGRSKLRGTEIIPSGVLPKVVAQAITGPNSKLRINGAKPDTATLINACREEWVTKTYPWVKANLINRPQRGRKKKKTKRIDIGDGQSVIVETGEEQEERNLVAQRIAIEDMQQALARLDGFDANSFSELYGVDTSLHYRIEEYRDTNVEYAQTMNGLYDSDAVMEFQNQLFAEIERQANEQKNSKEIGAIASVANIVTAGIKTNALFWNVPIAVSAVAEKGVGDVQTDLAVRSIARRTERVTGVSRMEVSQQLRDAFKTEEAHQSIDAALLILEIAGPQGLTLFSKTGKPLTQENASSFLQEKFIPNAASGKAAKVQEFNQMLTKFQQKLLTGDVAFKNKDAMNYLNALLTSNQVLIGAQEQLAADGRIDEHAGMALTGAELDDVFLANNGDITRFLAEVFGTPAGRDSLIMMRSNNIGNFNPIGYTIDKVLRNNAVPNALITTFFDSFPKYGINFLYTITPFSRSLTYLEMKRREAGGDITAGMFTMGGGLSDVSGVNTFGEAMKDPAFVAGLRMNLLFDAMTLGRWSLTTIVLGGVIAALGFEPPRDDDDFFNISMWKIGGQEIQVAYWLNDLTQLGLPGAYGFAAALSGHDPATCAKLALSSLYDQVDGNVIIDFIKAVKTMDKEIDELEKMGADPSYLSGFSPTYGVMELFLSAGDKIVPGAPLYRYIQNDAFLRGDYARAADPNKVYDKSSDWAKSVGKTDYVVDPSERQLRRHSTSNWMLAAYQDFVNGVMFNPDSDKTGYFWWEMPPRTRADQLILTWRAEQEMNYKDREGCKTDEAYKELKTDQLLKQIDKVTKDYGGLQQALGNGYFISHDVRYAALDVLSDRLIQNELEFQAMKESGVFAPSDEYSSQFAQRLEGDGDFYSALAVKKAVDNEIWDYIKILQNDDIPMWYNGYEQIISDKDITFLHEDGTPALPWEYLISNDVTAEWKLKGNHPWALLPITFVDTSSNEIVRRDSDGETVNFWYDEDLTNLEAIQNGIGKNIIPSGRDEGMVLNESLFDVDADGNLIHKDIPTVNDRAWIPKQAKLSDDIKNFDVSKKVKDATGDNDNDNNKSKNVSTKPRYYPTSYSRRSYGHRSRAGSGNYNPRIYNTSHNVNNDRAATMYTKQPQSARTTYLRPSFSTKGSREAYRRQDF